MIADFEAGLGNVSRLEPGQIDVFLVVAEPTAKSLEVARRAVDIIRENRTAKAVLVGNRLTGNEDIDAMKAMFPDVPLTFVPDDMAIREADARGVSAFDASHDAPAVTALRSFASSLSVGEG